MPKTPEVLQKIRDSIGDAIREDNLQKALESLELYKSHIATHTTYKNMGESLLNACLRDAIGRARAEIALALIETGCAPSLHDNLAIRLASSRGLFSIIPKLVEKGADPTTSSCLPLQLAAGTLYEGKKMIKTIKCLLKEIDKKIVNPKDSYLHKSVAATTACWKGNTPIAQTILESMDSKSLKKLSEDPENEYTVKPLIKPILRKRVEELIQKTNRHSNTLKI